GCARCVEDNPIAEVSRDDIGRPGRVAANQVVRRVDVDAVTRIGLRLTASEVRADEVALNDVAARAFEAKPDGEAIQHQPANDTLSDGQGHTRCAALASGGVAAVQFDHRSATEAGLRPTIDQD